MKEVSGMRVTSILGISSTLIVTASLAAAQSKTVRAGATWTIQNTTELTELVIGQNAIIQAADGHNVTLTVDGIERDFRPGTFHGHIVLTDTASILVKHLGDGGLYNFRTGIYIDNGAYVPEKSVAAAVKGRVSDSTATDLSITSNGEWFNGIVVTGNSTYTIKNPTLDMTGNGRDDFAGYGAAVASMGEAHVTLENAHIKTTGAVRTAVFVGGKSTMTVNHSEIEVFNGILPSGYKFSIAPGEMMEVPYGLGISGNVRATNLIDTGTVYYNDSHIRAQGWGALSSDGDGPTHMYATNTVVETVDSGYGAYANGDAHDVFKHCTFKVADYGLVIGGNGSGTFTDASLVNSRRIGVMMHQGTGGGTLIIDKGSSIHSRSAAIEVKGRGTNIIIDDASLEAENGVILQSMDNDDPIMKDMMKAPPTAPAGGAASANSTDMPGGGATHPIFSGNIKADFKNVNLHGDLVHAMKNTGEMILTFEHATLEGAISLGMAHPTSGAEPTRETYRTIGEVVNTLGPDPSQCGLTLSLDGSSKWVVTKTSYLSSLTVGKGTVVSGRGDSPVRLIVNGVQTPLKPGTYQGNLVVQVESGN